MDNLIFFIDDKITRLLNLLTHNSIHLGKFLAGLAAL